jgi:hypothetical protein
MEAEMADTVRGDFPKEVCECGHKGCAFMHWGELVPDGKPRYLCFLTMAERAAYFREHGTAKPDNLVTKHD